MEWPRARVSTLLWAPLILAGCAIGRTHVLFVTKTNAGLDVSTKPPTLELSISRLEGVVEPQFENGQTLPVMSSFKFETQRMFSPAVGSTFATGESAAVMAALYADETPLDDWIGRLDAARGKSATHNLDAGLRLELKPDPGRALSFLPAIPLVNPELEFQVNRNVEPVFFGTETSIGLKVAWSGMTAQFPDSVRFGYHRKEIALVAVAMETVPEAATTSNSRDTADYVMRLPSLLATVDTQSDISGSADFSHLQYFATGHAATLLALQRDVRGAMLRRLDPFGEGPQLRGLRTDQPGLAPVVSYHVLAVRDGLELLGANGDTSAQYHLAQMNAAADGLALANQFSHQGDSGVVIYQFDATTGVLTLAHDPPMANAGIERWATYSTQLTASVASGAMAKAEFDRRAAAGIAQIEVLDQRADPAATAVKPLAGTAELERQLTGQEALRVRVSSLGSDGRVLAAREYYLQALRAEK